MARRTQNTPTNPPATKQHPCTTAIVDTPDPIYTPQPPKQPSTTVETVTQTHQRHDVLPIRSGQSRKGKLQSSPQNARKPLKPKSAGRHSIQTTETKSYYTNFLAKIPPTDTQQHRRQTTSKETTSKHGEKRTRKPDNRNQEPQLIRHVNSLRSPRPRGRAIQRKPVNAGLLDNP